MKLYSKIKLKTLIAFIRGRRNSALIDFSGSGTPTDKFIFWVVRNFLKKNSKFEKIWKSDFSEYRIDIFLFRDFGHLKKFDISQKMTFAENPVEKPTLLGEALGFPSFAVRDFVELRDGKVPGDRIGIKCFEWGYDGLVCRSENFNKMKEWLTNQNIPLEKVIISDNETGAWRKWTFAEYEARRKD